MSERYKRLTNEKKEEIKKLTLEGNSLNYISKITGLGKTTIYYNVRKFKTRLKKEFKIEINNFQIGELIGAFAGDGTYFHEKYYSKSRRESHYRVRYCLSDITDKPYAQYLAGILKEMNLNPIIISDEKNNRIELCINSKDFIQFVKEYLIWEGDKTFSIRLRKDIDTYPDDFLRGFARGLMDTDGFLNPGNSVCACISERLIDNLSDIFTHFGLEISRTSIQPSRNRRRLFYVRVLRKSMENYEKIIGFSSQYKKDKIKIILDKNGDTGI